jgi:hypothetical protein
VNGLNEEFGGQINVYQLNAADPSVISLQGQYGVRGHPSFALIDAAGAVTARFLGPPSEAELRAAVEALVSNQR